MTRLVSLRILFLLSTAVLADKSFGQEEGANAGRKTPPLAVEIDKLIQQLDSDHFTVREEASARLEAIGEETLPALDRAAQSASSAEVRRRAEVAVARIREAIRARRIAKRIADAKKQAVDQFIDHIVARKHKVVADRSEEAWKIPVLLAQAITDVASETTGAQIKVPVTTFGGLFQDVPLLTKFPPDTNNTRGKRIATGEIKGCYNFNDCLITATRIVGSYNFHNCVILADSLSDSCNYEDCLVVCSGGMTKCHNMKRSILFVNGNLKECHNYEDGILFCNGDMILSHNMKNNVVLATGIYQECHNPERNVVQVRAFKQTWNPERNIFVNLRSGDLDTVNAKANQFVQTERGPLQVLRLFDLRQVGMEAAGGADGVQVRQVHAGQALARAGVQVNDRILKVDGTAIKSPEELRLLLRRKLPGATAQLTVQRTGKVVHMTLEF